MMGIWLKPSRMDGGAGQRHRRTGSAAYRYRQAEMPSLAIMNSRWIALAFLFTAAACTPAAPIADLQPWVLETRAALTPSPPLSKRTPQSEPFRRNPRRPDQPEVRIPELMGRDAIPPIYDPQFAPAEQAPLFEQELVLGVAWQGEAKAYPVTIMRSREMVNDWIGNTPILVSW